MRIESWDWGVRIYSCWFNYLESVCREGGRCIWHRRSSGTYRFRSASVCSSSPLLRQLLRTTHKYWILKEWTLECGTPCQHSRIGRPWRTAEERTWPIADTRIIHRKPQNKRLIVCSRCSRNTAEDLGECWPGLKPPPTALPFQFATEFNHVSGGCKFKALILEVSNRKMLGSSMDGGRRTWGEIIAKWWGWVGKGGYGGSEETMWRNRVKTKRISLTLIVLLSSNMKALDRLGCLLLKHVVPRRNSGDARSQFLPSYNKFF